MTCDKLTCDCTGVYPVDCSCGGLIHQYYSEMHEDDPNPVWSLICDNCMEKMEV